MSNVLIALFNSRLEAERAVDDLEQAGFDRKDVGFAIRGSDAVRGGMITDAVGTKDGAGAIAGATTGAIAGGLFGALATLAIPGIGPVLAGGILTTAFGFAAAGAATGGILGALAGLGLSEDEALFYQQQFECGRAIVTVRAGSRVGDAERILNRHGGFDKSNCPKDLAQTPPNVDAPRAYM